MRDLLVIRQPTVAETKMVFEFEVQGREYMVCNFTDGDIYAGINTDAEKVEMLLIPTECCRGIDGMTCSGSSSVTVIPTTSSEKGVEVQCLKW